MQESWDVNSKTVWVPHHSGLTPSFSPYQGGLVGHDENVALTAFVVIALHHGLAVFQDGSAQQLKDRVVRKPTRCPFTVPAVLSLGAGHTGSGLCFLLGSLHLQGK